MKPVSRKHIQVVLNTSASPWFTRWEIYRKRENSAHLKRCDWRKPQNQHADGERNQNTPPDSAKEKQNLSQAGKDHVVNINLCVKLVIPFIFTVIQGVKIRRFSIR